MHDAFMGIKAALKYLFKCNVDWSLLYHQPKTNEERIAEWRVKREHYRFASVDGGKCPAHRSPDGRGLNYG